MRECGRPRACGGERFYQDDRSEGEGVALCLTKKAGNLRETAAKNGQKLAVEIPPPILYNKSSLLQRTQEVH